MKVTDDDLKNTYSKLDSEELIQILRNKDLTDQAIKVLKEEIRKRGIDISDNKIDTEESNNSSFLNTDGDVPSIENLCQQYKVRPLLWWRTLATIIDFFVLTIGTFLVIKLFRETQYFPLIVTILIAAYYVFPEWKYGKTLGKHLVKIQVVNAQGEIPRFWQIIVRTVTRILEVNPSLAGGIPAAIIMGFSKKKQRLGDMLAKTYVVRQVDIKSKTIGSDLIEYSMTAS